MVFDPIETIAACRGDLVFASPLHPITLQIGTRVAEHKNLETIDRQMLLASMGAIQDDAAEEFYMALRFMGLKQEQLPELDVETQTRITGFLLLANVFNTGDSLLESYIGINGLPGENGIDFEILSRVPLYEANGISFNARDTFDLIEKLIDDVAEGLIAEKSSSIIQSNLRSIQLLKQGHYTLEQALEYRRDTIGQYADLLGRVLFSDQLLRPVYTRAMLEAQFLDDISDIYEDMFVKPQVNPLVAVARSHGLDNFVQVNQGLLELYYLIGAGMDLSEFNLPDQFDSNQFLTDINTVRNSYQNLQ